MPLEKPSVEIPDQPAPTGLVVDDLEVGDGAEAKPESTLEVHYVGVDYETGAEFDSSWDRKQSIEFSLDRLIAGWQEGIPGMREGGRRRIICPPEKAYGPVGGGHPLAGRTLVFIIDLLAVK